MEVRSRNQSPIAWVLTLLVLLQSCVVYHKTPSSLEQASQSNAPVKVIIANGKEYKFKTVTSEEGQYYGTYKSSGKDTRVLVVPEEAREVYLKNKGASSLATLGAIVVPIAGFVLIGRFIFESQGFDTGLEF